MYRSAKSSAHATVMAAIVSVVGDVPESSGGFDLTGSAGGRGAD